MGAISVRPCPHGPARAAATSRVARRTSATTAAVRGAIGATDPLPGPTAGHRIRPAVGGTTAVTVGATTAATIGRRLDGAGR